MISIVLKFKKGLIGLLLCSLWLSTYTYASETNTSDNILNSQSDEKTITGKVTSSDGETLPGVNIIAKGTVIGTITDEEGNFTLAVPVKTEVLVFSYVGYLSEEVIISDLTVVDLVLIPDFLTLSEIVVIGYGKVKKSDLTGSVVTISPEDFDNQPSTRMDQILQGRSSGVSVVNNTGAPGSDVKIRIRGTNSIHGDNNPLIIIDGVSGVGLGDVSTSDIESIEVLKDASSTAIYGSRGSNGVILVTTKSGKKDQKPKVNFNAFGSVSELPKSMDYLNAGEFATLLNEKQSEFGLAPAFTDEEVLDYQTNGGTDWEDEIFRTGYAKSYLLSFSGGGKTNSYYLSGEYVDQEGILINTNYKRYTFRAKVESDINEMLSIGANISGNRQFSHNNGELGSQHATIGRMSMWVATEPLWEEGFEGEIYNNSPNKGAIAGNPVGLQNFRNYDDEYNNALLSGFVNITPFKGFTLKASINAQVNSANNYFLQNSTLMPATGNSRTSMSNSLGIRTQSNIVGIYTKEINQHKIQLTGVFENMAYEQSGSSAIIDSLSNVSLGYYPLEINEKDKQSVSSFYKDEKLRSYAGRFNYVFASKYLLTATLRADGSSKFKGDNKWGTFPSVALGWNASKEQFIKNLNVFSHLKLRLSWGVVGSQAIKPYATLTRFGSDNAEENLDANYAIEGPAAGAFTGTMVGSPGNENLKWETTTERNIGFEMAFFQGRLRFEGDYYHKLTDELLIEYVLPTYSGGLSVFTNAGSVENNGFDFLLSGVAVSRSNFFWKIGFNMSVNKNKVISLGDEESFFPGTSYSDVGHMYIVKKGEPLGSFWGRKFEGVWSKNDSINGIIPPYTKPGDARIGDSLQIIGHAAPDFTYGINNTFTVFKNFEVNIFLQGSKGGQIYNMQRQNSYGINGQARDFTSREWLNRWTQENQDTDIPSFSSSHNRNVFTNQWLEDASYLRLKNISIAYNIPSNVLKYANISSFQVYISAQNLFTITNYKGYDPEASTSRGADYRGSSTDTDQNIDSGAYPNPRTYTFGVKISF